MLNHPGHNHPRSQPLVKTTLGHNHPWSQPPPVTTTLGHNHPRSQPPLVTTTPGHNHPRSPPPSVTTTPLHNHPVFYRLHQRQHHTHPRAGSWWRSLSATQPAPHSAWLTAQQAAEGSSRVCPPAAPDRTGSSGCRVQNSSVQDLRE